MKEKPGGGKKDKSGKDKDDKDDDDDDDDDEKKDKDKEAEKNKVKSVRNNTSEPRKSSYNRTGSSNTTTSEPITTVTTTTTTTISTVVTTTRRKKILQASNIKNLPDPDHLNAPKNFYEPENNDKYNYPDMKISTQNLLNVGSGYEAAFLAYLQLGTASPG